MDNPGISVIKKLSDDNYYVFSKVILNI